jgi:tetratricopeptide (TPR) repeat protein
MEAAAHFDRSGYKRASTEPLANAACVLMEMGQLEMAEEQMRRLEAIAERLGLNHLMGGILYVLENILAYAGNIDEARSFGERAIKWTAENNDHHFHRFARLYLSVIEYYSGNYELAEQHARQALLLVEENPSLRPFALAALARSLLAQAKPDALSLATEAYSKLRELGTVQDGEAPIRLAYIECLRASSQEDKAREAVKEAVARLRDQRASIGTSDWQHSFVSRIPEHLRIVQIAIEYQIELDFSV